jgi:membrane fusion protein (multidrug efflux system)
VIATDRVGSNWVIEKGLKAGDRVIVEGLLKTKPGDVVQVEERAAPPVEAALAPTPAAAAPERPGTVAPDAGEGR